jgi:heme exporter protein D
MNWAHFFSMGGYGFYVWSAYALALIVLALNTLLPLTRRKTVLKRLRELGRLDNEEQY